LAEFKLKTLKNMKKLVIAVVLSLVATGIPAQSLRFISANYPGIYSRFSDNGQVNPTEQSDTFTSTNVPVTCTLDSRSFAATAQNTAGQYGYEYQLTLNNGGSTDSNVLSVSSLTLNFGQPLPFAFGLHASNYVWVVTTGGPVGLAPSEADLSGNMVTIQFDPPLTLATQTDQATNTYYFGLSSTNAPEITKAILQGTTEDPVNGTLPFKVKLQAQTP
jgi:hypothetical protein